MTAKRFTGIRLDLDLLDGLDRLRSEHGAPFSESIRRAIREYLERKGVIKAARKRVAARKRA
jgi:metal-responsive CopG/Arc/MetJ family transcriptional regulator